MGARPIIRASRKRRIAEIGTDCHGACKVLRPELPLHQAVNEALQFNRVQALADGNPRRKGEHQHQSDDDGCELGCAASRNWCGDWMCSTDGLSHLVSILPIMRVHTGSCGTNPASSAGGRRGELELWPYAGRDSPPATWSADDGSACGNLQRGRGGAFPGSSCVPLPGRATRSLDVEHQSGG